MRVLLSGESSGAAFTFVRTLALALDRRGCQVTVALSGLDRPRGLDADGVEVLWRPGQVEWMDQPWADVDATGEWLLEIAARRRPEIVHVNAFSQAGLGFDVPVLLSAHSDLLTWWRDVRGEAPPPQYDEYRRRLAAGLRAAAAVAVPTSSYLVALQAQDGNVANAAVIAAGSAIPVASGPKQSLVLGAGRLWDEGKNLRAIASVQLPRGWTLAVAGPRRQPDRRSAAVPGARMLGDLGEAELSGWLTRAAVYVNPALYDPFGLGVLEAGRAGCALVLADIPTLRETWDGAALFADPRDPEAIGTALWLAATNGVLRSELGARAQDRARRYTADAMADAYLTAYRDLARSRALASRS